MWKKFQEQPVTRQLVVILSSTLAVFFCFLALVVFHTVSDLKAVQLSYIDNLISQLRQTITVNYDAYAKIIRLIAYNNDVQEFLLTKNDAVRFDLYTGVRRNLSDFATLNSQIMDIVLFDTQGQRYNLSDRVLRVPAMDLSDNALHVSSLQTADTRVSSASYLVIGKDIHSIDSYEQTNRWIGSIYLILEAAAFTGSEKWGDFKGGTDLFLVDSAGSLLWSDSPGRAEDTLQQAVANQSRYSYFIRQEIAPIGTIIACQQQDGFFSNVDWKVGYLLLLIALLLFILFGWTMWTRNIVRPLRALSSFIERFRHSPMERLDSRVTLVGYREIQIVGSEFNHMLGEIKALTAQQVALNTNLYESKLLAKQSELSHLRSQINPHFLYNTLETLVGIAYGNQQPEIAKIARALSLIFKYSIKGGEMVPLSTEFKIIKNYLFIQHVRFGNRFDVQYQLDEDCLDDCIPKMILQPLIENAIVHGIEGQTEHCRLIIGARREGDCLSLTVEDDGAGIPEQRLRELDDRLSSTDAAFTCDTSHIGILNVNNRIRLMYGPAFGVCLESSEGKGTRVTLRLPVQKGGETNVSSDAGGR